MPTRRFVILAGSSLGADSTRVALYHCARLSTNQDTTDGCWGDTV
jgi:hypothetical protein